MKTLLTAALLTTGLIAGGDIAPIEPTLKVQEIRDPSNFYAGLGVMYVYTNEETNKKTTVGGTGIVGYQFNEPISLELRGTLSDGSFSKYGAYMKISMPIYKNKANLYALGGYSQIHFKDTKVQDSGEIGVGLEAKNVMPKVDIFIDGLYVLRTERIVPLVGFRYNF